MSKTHRQATVDDVVDAVVKVTKIRADTFLVSGRKAAGPVDDARLMAALLLSRHSTLPAERVAVALGVERTAAYPILNRAAAKYSDDPAFKAMANKASEEIFSITRLLTKYEESAGGKNDSDRSVDDVAVRPTASAGDGDKEVCAV